MNIYFDETLIDNDYIMGLDFDGKLFNDNDIFVLGSTLCNNVKLIVSKDCATQPVQNVEISNLGVYNIDNIEEDDYSYIYTLIDNMINFNFRYDAQPLIENSEHTEADGTKYVLLSEIVEDICDKAGTTLITTNFMGKNKHITWYDNTITAREYIGMVAELNSGYVVDINGLQFKQYSNTSSDTILFENCADYKIGEKHIITRVAIENGIFEPVGTETGTTVYLNQNNVFITEQQDLINIYNVLNGYEFYSIEAEIGDIVINTNLIGSCITFSDGTNTYKSITQINASYNGGWYGKYHFIIGSNKQEVTAVINSVEDNYKRLKFQMDRNTNEIDLLSEKIEFVSNTITGTGSITLENAYEGTLHHLTITGQMNGQFPSTTIYPSSTTYGRNGIILNIDTNKFILPIDILNYISPNVCDKFIYEDGKCKIYRMVEVINNVKVPLANPYYENRDDILLEVTENSTISLQDYNNAYFTCIYLLQNEWTDEFVPTVDAVAKINLSPGKATIDANKINLEGKVINLTSDNITINSNNFKVDAEGHMECTNAKITGGQVNIDVGTNPNKLQPVTVAQTINNKQLRTNVNGNGLNIKDEQTDKYLLQLFGLKGMLTPALTLFGGEQIMNAQLGTTGIIDPENGGGYLHLYSCADGNKRIRLEAESQYVYFSLHNGTKNAFKVESTSDYGRVTCYEKLVVFNSAQIDDNLSVSGNLTVYGSKNRAVQIDNKKVKLYAYETASPYFGDIGSSLTDNKGYCKINIEKEFLQTIENDDYKVFIQECGEGHLWVEKHEDYFEVKGTPNLEFDYEIKAVQKGYKNIRLEEIGKEE